ncbi:MAG: 6-phosphofructokinase [Chloroflexi bacterium]|nr:6-phosphofructokinase [Chloroflexota bacterium]
MVQLQLAGGSCSRATARLIYCAQSVTALDRLIWGENVAVRRIGILTGGGDCPGLNAVIRATVKAATALHNWTVIGILDGFEGLLAPGLTRELTAEDVRGILPRGGTILGTTNRGNPFAYALRRGDRVEPVDRSAEVVENSARLGLDALVVIGGDGTLRIARDLHRLGLPVVGVPKTIDNDLATTDVTFGFDTALQTATEAIDKLHTTAESHHRVMLVEVMGRNAGWIALEAGLAGGADVVLIPEIPFRVEAVAERIAQRTARGRAFSIVVVAEGAAPHGEKQVFQQSTDAVALARLGGIAHVVGYELQQRTPHETRVTVLGHLQRGGSPSPFDRILGTRFGAMAVELVARGGFGRMVALHTPRIEDVSLDEAVDQPNRVPPSGELVCCAEAVGISFGA